MVWITSGNGLTPMTAGVAVSADAEVEGLPANHIKV
jgi:hypothetical protein